MEWFFLFCYVAAGSLVPLSLLHPRWFEIHFSSFSALLMLVLRNYLVFTVAIMPTTPTPIAPLIIDIILAVLVFFGWFRCVMLGLWPRVDVGLAGRLVIYIWAVFSFLPLMCLVPIAIGTYAIPHSFYGRIGVLIPIALWFIAGFWSSFSPGVIEEVVLSRGGGLIDRKRSRSDQASNLDSKDKPKDKGKGSVRSVRVPVVSRRVLEAKMKAQVGAVVESRSPHLRVLHLTDIHVHPVTMPYRRLRRLCESAAALVEMGEIDMCVFTGDLCTHDVNFRDEAERLKIVAAFAPLSNALASVGSDRMFAVLGNHDIESSHITQFVSTALTDAGFVVLRNAGASICIGEAGGLQVNVMGIDFVWPMRARHIIPAAIEQACGDVGMSGSGSRSGSGSGSGSGNVIQLLLIHDPASFKYVPADLGATVLSGHLHGGQIGLSSVGIPWTILRFIPSMFDQGLFHRGSNALYVSRCTGYYGMALRLGVSSEQSILSIER